MKFNYESFMTIDRIGNKTKIKEKDLNKIDKKYLDILLRQYNKNDIR